MLSRVFSVTVSYRLKVIRIIYAGPMLLLALRLAIKKA